MKEKIEDKVMDIIGGHSRCYLGEMDTQSRLVEDLNLDSSDDGLLGYCDRTPRLKHGQLGKTRRHWRIGGKVYKSDEKFYEALAKWGGGEQ